MNKAVNKGLYKSASGAFTLIELLVVMAIIGILAGMTFGLRQYANNAAQVSKCKSDIENIHNALTDYKLEYGKYPTNFNNAKFIALLADGVKYTGGTNIVDPWGRTYVFNLLPNDVCTLYSLGPDATNKYDNIQSGN